MAWTTNGPTLLVSFKLQLTNLYKFIQIFTNSYKLLEFFLKVLKNIFSSCELTIVIYFHKFFTNWCKHIILTNSRKFLTFLQILTISKLLTNSLTFLQSSTNSYLYLQILTNPYTFLHILTISFNLSQFPTSSYIFLWILTNFLKFLMIFYNCLQNPTIKTTI